MPVKLLSYLRLVGKNPQGYYYKYVELWGIRGHGECLGYREIEDVANMEHIEDQ